MPEFTHREIRDLLQGWVSDEYPQENDAWVEEVMDETFVFINNGEHFRSSYKISDSGEVEVGEPERVKITFEAFAELQDVEVAKLGTFTTMNGKKVNFSEQDLEDIARNGNALAQSKFHDAPLVVSHAEGDQGTAVTVGAFGSPTGGYFHNFRVEGDTVKADLRDMPQKAAEIIGTSASKISPEFYPGEETQPDFFKSASKVAGKIAGKVMRRVALVDIPAIKSLGDIPAVAFGEPEDDSILCISFHEAVSERKPNGGKKMSEKIVEQLKKDVDRQGATIEEQGTELVKLREENAKLRDENSSHAEEISKQEKERTRSECEQFCEGLVKSGQLTPAAMEKGIVSFMATLPGSADSVIKFAEGADAPKVSPREFFKDMLSGAGTVISFGETKAPDKKPGGGEFMELVEKYQADHDGVTKAQAMGAVIESHPEVYEKFQEASQAQG